MGPKELKDFEFINNKIGLLRIAFLLIPLSHFSFLETHT
jgi:hypothetical protein